MKIGDLMNTHPTVHRMGEASLPTRHGHFRVLAYHEPHTGAEHLALTPIHNPPNPEHSTLVRVHSECLTGDGLGSLRCDCGPQLDASLTAIAAEGGIVIYLRGHEGRGIGLAAKIRAYELQDTGLDTVEANLELGLPVDARDYGVASAILVDLGITTITLLTNNPAKAESLIRNGTTITSCRPLTVGHGPHNHRYLETKRTILGHHLTAHPTDQGLTT